MANVKISALSRQYVKVPVTAEVNGAEFDPTADQVQMAILEAGATPGVSDWLAADWETDVDGSHLARCLVGPGGVVTLVAGKVYQPWVKVSDSPEVPVLISANKLVVF